jgi:hypothetical protein
MTDGMYRKLLEISRKAPPNAGRFAAVRTKCLQIRGRLFGGGEDGPQNGAHED